ncbi:unnamed protein product [Caenorhabditis bovis]|uniref:CUB domain-containing protein n=1 Tax=Caenorhabditis bovis TaxID=2654633 RepID=A0A8S1EFZ5_9PELO|nr:unnamed protein product [Caenorhabditis bovis]
MPTSFLLLILLISGVLSEPISSFFDGQDIRNECKTRLDRRLTGFSGLLYSHSKYGKDTYNASRNCVLMIVSPLGYQVRVRALEFDVSRRNGRACDTDTLHLFDHETNIDPESPIPTRYDDIISPGPIIGQFCGEMENRILNESTNNAMTLWWHSNPTSTRYSKGFKLHWTSFRVPSNGVCNSREFSCGNGECIPRDLACDKYADCLNGEDLIHSRQLAANCQNIELDPLTTVSGAFVLLSSAVLILSCCFITVCLFCLCRTGKTETSVKGTPQTQTPSPDFKPEPPQFYPPSPPKIPPPSVANSYTPRKHNHFDGPFTHSDGSGFHVRVPIPQYPPEGEYTYVRNDVHRNLI